MHLNQFGGQQAKGNFITKEREKNNNKELKKPEKFKWNKKQKKIIIKNAIKMTKETRELHYPSWNFLGRFNGSLELIRNNNIQSTICHPSPTCCQLHIHFVSPTGVVHPCRSDWSGRQIERERDTDTENETKVQWNAFALLVSVT